jgi:hydroxymethylbilane synthase
MMNPIRIGTRKSPLALWQANWVLERLRVAGIPGELVAMETIGDKKLDTSIAKIGSKGVFTQELEEKLANGELDIAVHSAKDLASSLPDGFEIIAYGEREQPYDVLVSVKKVSLSETLVLGTSSTRRVAQLARHCPHIRTVPVRGNLQTRLSKLKEGICDALLLAYAGVHRMGLAGFEIQPLDLGSFTPAAGQGSVAVECFRTLGGELKAKIREAINHAPTERAIVAERAFLATLQGGCSIPVYAHARLEGNEIRLSAGLMSLDGTQNLGFEGVGTDPVALGQLLGHQVLTAGGRKILAEIKNTLE